MTIKQVNMKPLKSDIRDYVKLNIKSICECINFNLYYPIEELFGYTFFVLRIHNFKDNFVESVKYPLYGYLGYWFLKSTNLFLNKNIFPDMFGDLKEYKINEYRR